MKPGNVASIDHNGNFELSEITDIQGDQITVKLCSTGEVLTVYPEELIVLTDSL